MAEPPAASSSAGDASTPEHDETGRDEHAATADAGRAPESSGDESPASDEGIDTGSNATNKEGALDPAAYFETEQDFYSTAGRCMLGHVTYAVSPPDDSEAEDATGEEASYRYHVFVQPSEGEPIGAVSHRFQNFVEPKRDRAEWMGFFRGDAWWWSTDPPGRVRRSDVGHLEHARRGLALLEAVESSFNDGSWLESFEVVGVQRAEEMDGRQVNLEPRGSETVEWSGLEVRRVELESSSLEEPNVLYVRIATADGTEHELFSGKKFTGRAEQCLERSEEGRRWPTANRLLGQFLERVKGYVREETSSEDAGGE